jgi:hypothetical protein
MAPGRAVEWRNQHFRVLFFLPFLLTAVRFSLVCAPFDQEQQRSAHGGQREKAVLPWAPSPELALPLLVECSFIERRTWHSWIPHGGGETFSEASR